MSNEDAYLHYFKQLLELDYWAKNSEIDDLQQFQISLYNKMHTTKMSKIKNSKKTKIVRHDTIPIKESFTDSSSSKTRTLGELSLNVHLTEATLDRIQLREAMLVDFQIYCYDNEAYESFFNRLIDFEESLIKE